MAGPLAQVLLALALVARLSALGALAALGAPAEAQAAAEKPKLIPLAAAESGYSENSSVNLLCTLSQGHHDSLTFDWFKDGQTLAEDSGASEPTGTPERSVQIDRSADHSLLRIRRVRPQHAGRYTCAVRNQFGQDSSSVNLIVNVKLHWAKEPPGELVVKVEQEVKVDCLALGEPKPSMRWERLDANLALARTRGFGPVGGLGGQLAADVADGIATGKSQLVANPNGYKLAQQQQQHRQQQSGQSSLLVSSGRQLNIARAKLSDAGMYECIASNAHDADLRKLVNVQVRGPPKILPIATADSYPEGSSINLICTVSGGQRRGLVLSWQLDGRELQAEQLKYSEGLENVSIGMDDADISILRIKNATQTNSGVYSCLAKNPLGEDSTSVKIVINVELKWSKIPKDVEVGLNQELQLECDAIGLPPPSIEWTKHAPAGDRSSNHNGTLTVAKGRTFRLAKTQLKDSGLYECLARNGVDDDLRKLVQVKVRGK